MSFRTYLTIARMPVPVFAFVFTTSSCRRYFSSIERANAPWPRYI
jgi:hypothetical protein